MQRWSKYAVLALAALLVSGAGCKDSRSDEAGEQSTPAAGAMSSEEEALLQRRDALLSSRRKLRERQRELAEERRRVVETGGDASELLRKTAELSKEAEELGAREDEIEHELESLLSEQRTMLASLAATRGSETAQMAAREAGLAGRERTLATRESRLAEREATLAERERRLAARERDTCGAGAATTIIQQAPAPEGTRYRRKDVEPILQRARRNMSRRGVLRADLPAPARALEQEATKAMEKADYGRARFAASQLLSTVDAIKIDKAFIQAKIGRLSNTMKGTSLPAGAQSKVDSLFKQATSAYGDGKFTLANKRLNEIYALIGGA